MICWYMSEGELQCGPSRAQLLAEAQACEPLSIYTRDGWFNICGDEEGTQLHADVHVLADPSEFYDCPEGGHVRGIGAEEDVLVGRDFYPPCAVCEYEETYDTGCGPSACSGYPIGL